MTNLIGAYLSGCIAYTHVLQGHKLQSRDFSLVHNYSRIASGYLYSYNTSFFKHKMVICTGLHVPKRETRGGPRERVEASRQASGHHGPKREPRRSGGLHYDLQDQDSPGKSSCKERGISLM